MVKLTFRILSGTDRGQVHVRRTPLTIGRESGNGIQLNDLLVSRCHLKIQEDEGVVLLADCDSTNGTRVNGEPVRQWILRPGDLVTLGNTTMLVGTRVEIMSRLLGITRKHDALEKFIADGSEQSTQNVLNHPHKQLEAELQQCDSGEFPPDEILAAESLGENPLLQSGLSDQQFFSALLTNEARHRELFQNRPPCLPTGLSPCQMAQMSELLQYLYLKLRKFQDTMLGERQITSLMGQTKATMPKMAFGRDHAALEMRECEHAREASIASEKRVSSPSVSPLAASVASVVPPLPSVPLPPANGRSVQNVVAAPYEPNDVQPLSVSTESSVLMAAVPPHPYFAFQWQNILDVEAQLAAYLHQMEQPSESE
ncbi:MAG: FHA domain-containing protein [Thermoguttaceae bacterium]|nr:FHA domain-containing protein [Thermoguttaceae bacterium]